MKGRKRSGVKQADFRRAAWQMNASTTWKQWRNAETRQVEQAFQTHGFKKVHAYRYNSASIRVRIIDPRFKGKNHTRRFDMAETVIAQLPDELRSEITFLALLTPEEARDSTMNEEFENPSPPE
jgi:hypothetical protein